MSSYYGVVFPEFWTGPTGRELREQGGKDAQLIGMYLATNRHANMIGLYRLAVIDVRHETGLGVKAIERGLAACELVGFAKYDTRTSFVWVIQMVRFRLGLKVGESLTQTDKRVIGVNKLYHGIESNPFLGEFYDRNRQMLRLHKRREPQGTAVPYAITSPTEAPSRGLGSQDQKSGSDHQDQEKARLTPPPARVSPRENVPVIRALLQDVLREAPHDASFTDLKDLAKDACAKHDIDYDADTVASALEQAMARRRPH